MNPFTSSIAECTISYSCEMIAGPLDYDLCNYASGKTTSSFDSNTGDYSISSDDYQLFGTQTVIFKITVTSGSTP